MVEVSVEGNTVAPYRRGCRPQDDHSGEQKLYMAQITLQCRTQKIMNQTRTSLGAS